jgi:signal transduction histidine kinase
MHPLLLSFAYGIVKKHGRIEVESQPGQGAGFRVIPPIDPPREPAP